MAKTSLSPARIAVLADEWRAVAKRAIYALDFALEGIGGYDHPCTWLWRVTPALVAAAGPTDGDALADLADELIRPNDPPQPTARYKQYVARLWTRCQPILDDLCKATKQLPNNRSRRPSHSRKPRPLTAIQTEAIQVVGECKGNVAQAAVRLGKDRKTVDQAYKAGLAKLGKAAVKRGTRTIARDRRGQIDFDKNDDRRG